MKFILQHLLVMLVFMCSMVIQAQAEEGIKPSSKMLFLGNHDNYPPFSYLDGIKPDGIVIDSTRAIIKKANIDEGLKLKLNADGAPVKILERWPVKQTAYVKQEAFDYYRLSFLLVVVSLFLTLCVFIYAGKLRKAKHELETHNEKTQSILNNIPIPVFWLAVKPTRLMREVLFVNKYFVRTFGYTLEEVSLLQDLFHKAFPEEEYRQYVFSWWRSILSNINNFKEQYISIPTKEFLIAHKDGTRLDVLVSANISDGLLLVSFLDISQRKQAERVAIKRGIDIAMANEQILRFKEMEQLNLTLEKTVFEKNQLLKSMAVVTKANSMGNLVSSLAHEINNPLGAMSINTQMLKLELDELKESIDSDVVVKMQELSDQILKDNARAATVVTRLRKLFLQGGSEFLDVNLSEVLDDVCDMVSREIANNDITLRIITNKEVFIKGDLGQVEMVFLNAFNNAIDVLRNHQGPREIEVLLKYLNEEFILVKIQDTGPGFDPCILKKRFELFQTTKTQGMGVGLWLSRAIMENHNGAISVRNRSDRQGAELTLRFYRS